MDALTYEPTEYLRGTFPPTLAITYQPTEQHISEIYLSVIISVCGIVVILAIIYLRKVYNARL
jgi:uncharacterized membrane protein affecting hemolysin expression